MSKKDNAVIEVICVSCAEEIGADINPRHLATSYTGLCDVCGQEKYIYPTSMFWLYCPKCKQAKTLQEFTFTRAKKKCRELCEECRKRIKYESKQWYG